MIDLKCEWLQEFENIEHMEKCFEEKLPRDVNYIICWYGYGNYCGDSYVLYEKDGKYFENYASHCSCCELEGQWEPEETTIDELIKTANRYKENKKTEYYDGENEYKDKFIEIIDKIKHESNYFNDIKYLCQYSIFI